MTGERRQHVSNPSPKPLLIWDGECDFCRLWIEHWRAITAGKVEYATYQNAAHRFGYRWTALSGVTEFRLSTNSCRRFTNDSAPRLTRCCLRFAGSIRVTVFSIFFPVAALFCRCF